MNNEAPQDPKEVALLPPTTKLHAIIRMIAIFGLTAVPLVTIENLGFTSDNDAPLFHMDDVILWSVIVAIGLFSGVSLAPKKWMLGAFSGLIASVGMNGLLMLYVSFRESVNMYELLIPILLGAFIGFKIFKSFAGNPETVSEESL